MSAVLKLTDGRLLLFKGLNEMCKKGVAYRYHNIYFDHGVTTATLAVQCHSSFVAYCHSDPNSNDVSWVVAWP